MAKTKKKKQQDPAVWGMTFGLFPGIIDPDREYVAGTVIREACEIGEDMHFYLKCSVGELAQRVVLALQEVKNG